MKLISQFLVLLFVSNIVFAQSNQLAVLPKHEFSNAKPLFDQKQLEKFSSTHQQSRGLESRWITYPQDYADVYQNGETFTNLLMLFPDSNIIYGSDTSAKKTFSPFWHMAATNIDPYHLNTNPWSFGSTYTLDSLNVWYSYVRQLDESIVDTLEITIVKDVGLVGGFVTGDTHWSTIQFDKDTKKVKSNCAWKVIKYALTSEDTVVPSYDGKYYYYKLRQRDFGVEGVPEITSDRVIGACINFIPGYPYSLTDSLFKKNYFYLWSSEENGDSTLPHPYVTGDNNFSYLLPNTVYYNIDKQNWNGNFVPTYAYTQGLRSENHMISFKLSSNNLGTNDLLVDNQLNFSPNPAEGAANLFYSLDEPAKKVSMKVFDVTGKIMDSFDTKNVAAGDYSKTINLDHLTSGIYFYSFSIDEKNHTGKFIVK